MVMKSRKSSKRERRVVSARQSAEEHKSGAAAYLALPDGVQTLKVKSSILEVDILPYVVGAGNPNAKEGSLYFMRTFWIHRGIGADPTSHICLSKTLKKPCPVCEYRAKEVQDSDHDEKYVKKLAPSERQLFNLRDLNEKDKGVQILDYSYHLLAKTLLAKIRKYKDGRYDTFADLEEGLSITLEFDEEKVAGYSPFWKCTGVEFVPRKKSLDESIIEECYCLDELLKPLSYKELLELFHQTASEDETDDNGDDDDEEEKSKGKGKSSARVEKEEDEEEEEEDDNEEEVTAEDKGIKVGTLVAHEDFGKCKVVHVSKDGTLLRLEDEDEEVHKAVSPGDVEVIKKKGKKVEEEDDTEDEDEDEPAPKKRGRPAKESSEKTKKRGKKEEDEDDEDEDEEWKD